MLSDVKRAQIEMMPTDAIQNIVEKMESLGKAERTPERPLGGMVHIMGIGQVLVEDLTTILIERSKEAWHD